MLDKLVNAVGLGGHSPLQQANTLTTSTGQAGVLAASPYTVPGGYGAQLGSYTEGSYTDETLVNIQVSIADNGFIFRMGRRTVIASKLEDLTDTFTSSIASVMLDRQDK